MEGRKPNTMKFDNLYQKKKGQIFRKYLPCRKCDTRKPGCQAKCQELKTAKAKAEAELEIYGKGIKVDSDIAFVRFNIDKK